MSLIDAIGSLSVDQLRALLPRLTWREREILKLRTGIGDGNTYTLEEVGHIFKVTRERIRQIERKAEAKIYAYAMREKL